MIEVQPVSAVVLISGNGSNLKAIIDAVNRDRLSLELRAVISNNPNAYGLTRAKSAGIPTQVLPHSEFPDRETFDRALLQLIDSYHPQLLILAGFMRILSEPFVRHYEGRILNIHPSLLPKYRGLNTHQRAIDDGETLHGATVQFVTYELDGGPAIVQAQVPVHASDTKESLAARVLEIEHKIYPLAIGWFAQGRLKLSGNEAVLDGRVLKQPYLFQNDENNPSG